jgi:D-3-phosphoglycerate dehydrogenase
MVEQGKKIILAEPDDFPADAELALQSIGKVAKGPFTRDILKQELQDASVLVVRLGHMIDRDLLKDSSNLKAIVTATTGLNHIDLDYTEERGIEVLSLKGERSFLEMISPTADLTFGLILSLLRNIPAAAQDVLSGSWDRDSFKGYDLRGKTLGIYGLGRIGRKVARMGLAFDMNVIAYDIAPSAMEGVTLVDERSLLEASDIVSLHIPYSDPLKSFFNAEKFALMRKDSYFINTARGELLDENSLLTSLTLKRISGAALDVLDGEYGASEAWVKSHPLIQYAAHNKNLIITPHIGGASYDSMARVENFMIEKLKQFLATS